MFEVIRVNKTENFTVISNIHLRDDRLSLKTKGLMTVMLSLPSEKWDLSIAGLATITHEGQSSIRTCLKELENAGYFEKYPIREGGRIRKWGYVLNESPKSPDVEILDVEKLHQEKLQVEKLKVENRMELNTYSESNTKDNKELKERNDIQVVVDAWNSAGGLPVKKVTASSTRGKMLLARINEYGLDDVLNAVNEYKLSAFLRGQNGKGFVADFEWFVKPNNFPKVLEGKYRDKQPTWNRVQNKQSDLDYFLSQAGGVIYDERRNSEVVIGNEGDVQ